MAGFKSLSDNKKEVSVERAGRGDTEPRIKQKRTRKVLLYLTDDEFAILQENADKLGVPHNVYCRLKIFNS